MKNPAGFFAFATSLLCKILNYWDVRQVLTILFVFFLINKQLPTYFYHSGTQFTRIVF